ncbi:MAG: MerR family transcriptional regulator [Pseudonocardiaceae bacterium]
MPDQLDRQAASGPVTTGPDGATVPGPAGDEFVLGVAALARRLGVAPATLRTWDRRYGLGPAEHAPGAHRRYGPADIARLEIMQAALLRGAAPADAARHALAERSLPEPVAPPESPGPELAGPESPGPGPVPAGPELGEPQRPTRPVRVGGRSLRLPGADVRARGLARAAVSLDAASIRHLLDDSLATDGAITTWDLVVRPVLGAIADCWADTGAGVEIEHLLTEGALGAFRNSLWAAAPPGTPRPVLLSCVPDELHSLPLYPLAAALAVRGIRCRVLGAALPAEALTAAVRRIAPSVVFLWAQMAGHAAPDLLAGVPRVRPRARVFAGGPGWLGVGLPATAELVDTLTTATDRIAAAAGSGQRAAAQGRDDSR